LYGLSLSKIKAEIVGPIFVNEMPGRGQSYGYKREELPQEWKELLNEEFVLKVTEEGDLDGQKCSIHDATRNVHTFSVENLQRGTICETKGMGE
jgi:hypothetical protein